MQKRQFMSCAQGRGQPERRSARLSKTKKRRETEEPSGSQNPRAHFASGLEEELVVVQHQEDILTTRGSDQHSIPDQSSPGRARRTEGTDPDSSSEGTDNMPTTTHLKYSRFRGDGSQDIDDWFYEFESTALANQKDNEAKARIVHQILEVCCPDSCTVPRNWIRIKTGTLRQGRNRHLALPPSTTSRRKETGPDHHRIGETGTRQKSLPNKSSRRCHTPSTTQSDGWNWPRHNTINLEM